MQMLAFPFCLKCLKTVTIDFEIETFGGADEDLDQKVRRSSAPPVQISLNCNAILYTIIQCIPEFFFCFILGE